MTTYLLVDMHNLAHRSKHAVMGDVATKAGLALQIAFNSFRQCWRNFKVDHIVVCLESRSWRKDVYSGYKAQRVLLDATRSRKEREDDEFYFNVIKEFVEYLKNKTNVTVLQTPGAEADDLIARFIQIHPNDNHIIYSGDGDFYQLLADNVKIYDGTKAWTITNKSVLDENGNAAFRKKLMPKRDKEGKIIKNRKGEPVKESVKIMEPVPNAEYELFKKIIRGDSSDNIHPASPGARENGSSKKPGIKEAFDDRHGRGFIWNEFMLQEWDKVTDTLEDGTPVMTRVRVDREFKFNQQLIDLTAQPQDIKDAMDLTIVEAIQATGKPLPQIGMWFLKFCNEMDLVNLSKTPSEYAPMLAASYPKINI